MCTSSFVAKHISDDKGMLFEYPVNDNPWSPRCDPVYERSIRHMSAQFVQKDPTLHFIIILMTVSENETIKFRLCLIH